ncbi:hypothetical protein [Spiroplasma sp. SV19]|uniref:hypothetical protein n=1 Tax=Spiroplasma sp. SV19 TaxID=2570468 RepID=UPI0024B718F6|nr:hypothetical protein [Spiroplasma sp. SV19]
MTLIGSDIICVNAILTEKYIIAPIMVSDLYHPNFISILDAIRTRTVSILM